MENLETLPMKVGRHKENRACVRYAQCWNTAADTGLPCVPCHKCEVSTCKENIVRNDKYKVENNIGAFDKAIDTDNSNIKDQLNKRNDNKHLDGFISKDNINNFDIDNLQNNYSGDVRFSATENYIKTDRVTTGINIKKPDRIKITGDLTIMNIATNYDNTRQERANPGTNIIHCNRATNYDNTKKQNQIKTPRSVKEFALFLQQ